jgi:hypothetical protein
VTTDDASVVAGLHLTEIDGDDLKAYLEQLERAYARDMQEDGGVPAEVAEHRARRSTEELFPDGRLSPGSSVWRAEDGAAGRGLGRGGPAGAGPMRYHQISQRGGDMLT